MNMASLRPGALELCPALEACFSGRQCSANGAHAPSINVGASARQQSRHTSCLADPVYQQPRVFSSLNCLASLSSRTRLRAQDRCPPQQAVAGEDASSPSARLAYSYSPDRTCTAFTAAAQRLEGLLSRIGDGEEEMVDNFLSEEDPTTKLAVDMFGCGCAAVICWAFCAFCHIDPLGGASLSMASLKAAGLGVAVALPLVAASAAARQPWARRMVPELEDVWQEQLQDLKPAVCNMTGQQVQLFAACETITSVLLLLPMATGGLQLSFRLYIDHLEEVGFQVPALTAKVLALGVLTVCMYLSTALLMEPSEEEEETVDNAVSNSERYYVLLHGTEEGLKLHKAFNHVAASWLRRREVASQLAGHWVAHRWLLLGFLWYLTGDLACPVATALSLSAFEFHLVHQDAKPRVRSPK